MSGGKLRELLDTLGQLVLLSVAWLLLQLPVVTSVSATASLYYAAMKTIRREQGDPLKEFWSCFKRTWKKGCLHSLLAAGGIGVMLLGALRVSPAYWLGFGVLAAALIYLGPVLSRFELKFWEMWTLSFVMSVRFIHLTLLIALGAAAAALAQFYLLPMAVVLILPGAMCLGATFLVERALRRYMPEKKPDENAWYYE